MVCDSPLDRHDEEKFKTPGEGNPPQQRDVEAASHAEVKPLKGSNPPLSHELQTWFDGWSARRTLWYAKWNQWDRHSRRKGACERHDYGELVPITGDLLHGMVLTSCFALFPDFCCAKGYHMNRPCYPCSLNHGPPYLAFLSESHTQRETFIWALDFTHKCGSSLYQSVTN